MSVIRREQTNIVGGGGSKFSATVTMVYPNYQFWLIPHMLATLDPLVFCFDEFGVEIEPWNIVVVDANTVRVYFGQGHGGLGFRPAPSGKVVVM
jgi:hypothetical protein